MKKTCGSLTLGNPGARNGARIALIAVAFLLIAGLASARPPARTSTRLVWSPSKERIVMFGGSTPADSSRRRTYLNDVWEWRTSQWSATYPANPPVGRSSHAMVWDTFQNRLLVFGGIRGFDDKNKALLLDDTVTLEGDAWRDLNPPTKPKARQAHAFAFDQVRNRFVIFGGYDVDTVGLFDTWEFDGANWTRIEETGPQVLNPLMVYDPARDETLLIGISNEEVFTDRKTQMYKRSGSGAWTKVELPTEKIPRCTSFGALVYEELFTRVVMQGGGCATGSPVNETWVWHGTEWSQLQPRTTPGFVTNFGMANEPTRQQSVLFGGFDFEERSQSYIFRRNGWEVSNEIMIPGGRSLFAFAEEPVTGRILLMGGLDDRRSTYNDLWSFRSGAWERMISNPYPNDCFNPIGTWDSDRKRFVAICDNGNVAEWDTVKWTSFDSLTPKPTSARFRTCAYDPKLKKTVMYGGFDEINYLRETWTWNGTAWTKLSKDAAAPKPRGLASMFFDPTSQRMMVYGGIGRPTSDDAVTRYGDMWAFEGTKWVELKPSTMPPIRYGAITAYNPETETVVMFGGKSAEELYLDEHWEWDGQNWKQLQPESRPSPRMNGGMAVDPTSGKLTMYGGYAGYYFQEAWTWSGGKWELLPAVTGRPRPVRPSSSESAPVGTMHEQGSRDRIEN
ncbi:MAG: Kelch repeat-containing protein [Thermoanaerobaculia bacterium]